MRPAARLAHFTRPFLECVSSVPTHGRALGGGKASSGEPGPGSGPLPGLCRLSSCGATMRIPASRRRPRISSRMSLRIAPVCRGLSMKATPTKISASFSMPSTVTVSCRVFEDVRVGRECGVHRGNHGVGVGVERHRQAHAHATLRVGQCHVAHGLGDELGVRHDHRRAIAHLDFGRANVDAADVAFDVAERDPIADFDRPLDQQDQTRNEILHDRLQAEIRCRPKARSRPRRCARRKRRARTVRTRTRRCCLHSRAAS